MGLVEIMDRKDDFEAAVARLKPKNESDIENQARPNDHKIDAFTEEAYRINDFISNLVRYFDYVKSAAHKHEQFIANIAIVGEDLLSSEQIDDMLAESRRLIKQAMLSVQQLQEHEKVIRNYSDQKTGLQKLFKDPNKEAERAVIAAHRSGIIMYLNQKLAQISTRQKKEQENRLQEQLSRSELSMSSKKLRKDLNPSSKFPLGKFKMSEEQNIQDQALHEELSMEQKQDLEQQNVLLLSEYDNALNHVRALEQSVSEISDLHIELINNLVYQNELSDRLEDSARQSSSLVSKGNQQLKQARRRGSKSTKFIVITLLTVSLMLLFLDWYH